MIGKQIKIILSMSIILLILDFFYLQSVSCFFKKQIFKVQNSKMEMDYIGVVLCYLLLCFGLYYFIISKKKSILDAFLLGFVIYGVFETTNKALLKNWQWSSVLIDTFWGGLLFSITTFLVYKLFY